MDPKLARLVHLAAGLCQDAAIRVDMHPTAWMFDPVADTIFVCGRDLATEGIEFCAAVLAHECAHRLVSRYTEFRPIDFRTEQEGAYLLNALEDPRANLFVKRRYPGVAAWLEPALSKSLTRALGEWRVSASPTLLQQFCTAGLAEAAGIAMPGDIEIDPRVIEVLATTRAARREYRDRIPAADFGLPAGVERRECEARYERIVEPLLRVRRRARPSLTEMEVCVSAAEAYCLAEAEILPHVRTLLAEEGARRDSSSDSSRSSVPAGAASGASARTASDPLSSPWAGHPNLAEAMRSQSSGRRAEPEGSPSGVEVLVGARSRMDPSQGGSGDHAAHRARASVGAGMPGMPGALWPLVPGRATEPQDYPTIRDRIASQIQRLRRVLEASFTARQVGGFSHGHARGSRIHVRSAMAATRDSRRAGRVWSRRTEPKGCDVAVSLLVDLSGSMQGMKIEAATGAAVLFAETLQAVGCPFAVQGFQDQVIPFVRFGDRLTMANCKALAEMPLEVSGVRPGGYNAPEFNDDAVALTHVAEELLQRPEPDRLLIVISDGEPAGRSSTADDLRRAVARLEGEPLALVGLGLGEGTGHVVDFYPIARAEVGTDEIADVVGGLIRRSLNPSDAHRPP